MASSIEYNDGAACQGRAAESSRSGEANMLHNRGQQLIFGLAVILGATLAVGCGRAKPVVTPLVKPTANRVSGAPQLSPAAGMPREAAAEPAEIIGDAAAEENAATIVGATQSSDSSADAAPVVPPISRERIVLLAPGNPIIIELQLTIDGRPHTEALERLVDEVLKIADTDGDGRTMWKELCSVASAVLSGTPANPADVKILRSTAI